MKDTPVFIGPRAWIYIWKRPLTQQKRSTLKYSSYDSTGKMLEIEVEIDYHIAISGLSWPKFVELLKKKKSSKSLIPSPLSSPMSFTDGSALNNDHFIASSWAEIIMCMGCYLVPVAYCHILMLHLTADRPMQQQNIPGILQKEQDMEDIR